MIRFVLQNRVGNVLLNSLLVAGLALFASIPFASAQQNVPQPAARTVALPLAFPTEFDGDLRFLPPVYMPPRYRLLNEGEPPPIRISQPATRISSEQPAVQALAPMPAPTANFAGLGFSETITGGQAGRGWPPDTNGDVGPTYYIQTVNTSFGVFNKSNGTQVTAFTINNLWSVSGTSTPCLNENAGDPVVLHDARNDRWVITDFAFAFSGGNPVMPFYECIAVSKTNDPVGGGWRFYAVRMDTNASGGPPSGTLNDYPKFGFWNNGCLYMGANGFTEPAGSYAGSIVASFSTTDMYAGNPLTSSIGWLAYNSTTGEEFGLFPADLLGRSVASLPPSGTPEYFVAQSFGDYAFDVRKFTPGTNCGAGGTLSSATQVVEATYNPSQGQFIPQPGTTDQLDSLGIRLMQRVQYRKIASAESLWVVHTTGDGTTTPAQPQWAQINVSGGTIRTTPVQQQIYAPDAVEYRWMPSLAVDGLGDMAMGYSRSSGNAGDYPSIYYAGRLAGNAANTLPQSEVALIRGGGSQTNACGTENPCYRWGDYSSMTIDPNDDCTFWHTNEYYVNQTQGTAGNWQTRIGAFKFPGCNSYTLTYTTDGNGVISGTTPQTVISGGSGTTVTAVPNTGYHFVQWSDGSTANPRTDTNVTASINVTARFAINTYTLTYNTGGNGTISGSTPQMVNYGASGTAVTAVPNTGYHFVHWSDGSTTNPRTDANVMASINVTATFAANVLVFTTQPSNVGRGNALGTVAVTEQDGSGNTVSDTATVDFATTTTCGTLELGSVAMVNGVATLSSAQRFYTLASNLTIKATVTNPNPTPMVAVTSNMFSVTANADFIFSDGFDGCRS